jgi:hypothetical protein
MRHSWLILGLMRTVVEENGGGMEGGEDSKQGGVRAEI